MSNFSWSWILDCARFDCMIFEYAVCDILIYDPVESTCSSSLSTSKALPWAPILSCWSQSACSNISMHLPNSPPIQLIPIALKTSSQTLTPSDDQTHKPWTKSSRSHRHGAWTILCPHRADWIRWLFLRIVLTLFFLLLLCAVPLDDVKSRVDRLCGDSGEVRSNYNALQMCMTSSLAGTIIIISLVVDTTIPLTNSRPT